MPAEKTPPAPISEVLANADAAEAAAAAGADLVDAVQKGVAAQAQRQFTTHSAALTGRLRAEEASLRETVADIDAKIAALNDERTDAMLAYSGVSHALNAIERGR